MICCNCYRGYVNNSFCFYTKVSVCKCICLKDLFQNKQQNFLEIFVISLFIGKKMFSKNGFKLKSDARKILATTNELYCKEYVKIIL